MVLCFVSTVLAMEPPAHFPVLCKKALRIALSLHRKQPQADLTRCRSDLPSVCYLNNDVTTLIDNKRHQIVPHLTDTLHIRVCHSNCLHSLIQLTLPSGVSEVQPCVLEEVWSYYEQALSIIASAVSWLR